MGLRVDRTGCESVVLDFDGTMCLLFQNHDLAATRRRMHEELGRFSIGFDEALDAFDAFDAVLAQTAEGFGVAGVNVGKAAILGQMTTGFPVSPLTASTFLLVGLSGVDLGEHQKKTIPMVWLISIIMLVVAVVTGGITI